MDSKSVREYVQNIFDPKKKLLECIYCSSKNIKKSIMAPMVSLVNDKKNELNSIENILKDEKNKLLKLRNYVEKNFNNKKCYVNL